MRGLCCELFLDYHPTFLLQSFTVLEPLLHLMQIKQEELCNFKIADLNMKDLAPAQSALLGLIIV